MNLKFYLLLTCLSATIPCGTSLAQTVSPTGIPTSTANSGTALWKDFYVGMSIEDASSVLKNMPTIKSFKIKEKKSYDADVLLKTGTRFPIEITDFIDQSKMNIILGYPVTFKLGFSSENKLNSISLRPVLAVTGNYEYTGLGCRGYTVATYADGKAFWETALSQKYQSRNEISDGVTAFTDGKVTAVLEFRIAPAAKRLTYEQKKANPYAAMSEMYKCYIDTYVPRIVYNDNVTFSEIQRTNKENMDSRIDNFIDKAKSDL